MNSPTISRRGWFALALLYALVVLYASTVVNIMGVRPAGFDLVEGWRRFMSVRYIEHGSDQRADWTANLLMIMPLGFMLTGWLWPRERLFWRGPAALLALAIAIFYVLAVKFAQLWFPRTVTINYIVAQSLGACAGVLLYALGYARLSASARNLRAGGRAALIIALSITSLVAFAFTLVPFDLVLSGQDFAERLARLPQVLLGIPGSGRSAQVRLVLLGGALGLTMPMGALFEAWRPGRGGAAITFIAVLAMTALIVPSLFIISTNPALITIPIHAVGFIIGAHGLRWLGRQHIALRRPAVARLGWLAILPYLALVLVSNGLASSDWQTLAAAQAVRLDPHRLLPLWTFYNISKAQATLSITTHAVMYAPIGMIIWAIAGDGRVWRWLAALLGLLLAALVEFARYLRPGLVPDINIPVIAAFAAGFGAWAAQFLWRVLDGMAHERQYRARHMLDRSS